MGFKEDFIAALRSGEYKKAKGVLNDGQGCFCVEGVATDVAIKGGYVPGVIWRETLTDHTDPPSRVLWELEDDSGTTYAPGEVCNLLSPRLDSVFEFAGESTRLMTINDLWGYSLSELADVVEEKFNNAQA